MRVTVRTTLLTPLVAAVLAHATLASADVRLLAAARSDDAPGVVALLKTRVNVDAPQGDGATALHWAAHWDNLAMAEALLAAGAKAGVANDLGVTPLWLACVNGSEAMADRLLKAGADPNRALPSGETPLMAASRSGAVPVVKALLARGANVNARERAKAQTALMWAVSEEHADVVKALVEGGADVNARSATRKRRVNTDAAGFGAGVVLPVEQGGFTAILFAARQGDVASARILLDAWASPNDAAPDGTTALVVASHSGHGALASLLLDRGANPNAAGAGYSALHLAIVREDATLIKALLARGADPNAVVQRGTGMRRASPDYALESQAIGAVPLWLAARFAQPDAMRLLAGAGATATGANKEGTPLVVAAALGSDERRVLAAVELALGLGADVNGANKDGNTAMHIAAQRRMKTVISLLAGKGAGLDRKNAKGLTPLGMVGRDVASESVAQLLRDLGGR
jgi:ankyrin repeat protein